MTRSRSPEEGSRLPMLSMTSTPAPLSSIGSSSIQVWLRLAFQRLGEGLSRRAELAIEHFAHAMRLSPLDPLTFIVQMGTAFAHFFAGRYDEHILGGKALRQKPQYHPALRVAAAANALAGRMDEAHSAIVRSRRLYPTPHISNFGNLISLRRPEDLARYADGLRKAGLPD